MNTIDDTEISLLSSDSNKQAFSREKQAAYDLLAQKSFLKNHQYAQRVSSANRSGSRGNSDYDVSGLEKTRYLFEYLYGMKGAPVRVCSGQYRMPESTGGQGGRMVEESDAVTGLDIAEGGEEVVIKEEEEEENGSLAEEGRQFIQFGGSGNGSLGGSVFGNWLAEYEKKKNRLSHRLNRAKGNVGLFVERAWVYKSALSEKIMDCLGSSQILSKYF
jgi:hypothetical protein